MNLTIIKSKKFFTIKNSSEIYKFYRNIILVFNLITLAFNLVNILIIFGRMITPRFQICPFGVICFAYSYEILTFIIVMIITFIDLIKSITGLEYHFNDSLSILKCHFTILICEIIFYFLAFSIAIILFDLQNPLYWFYYLVVYSIYAYIVNLTIKISSKSEISEVFHKI